MKKYIIYLFILIGISFQMACETDADIAIPAQDPKFVLTSFIKPGSDTQKFTLFMSDPIFDGSNGDNSSQITTATIKINDGTKTVKLKFNYLEYAYLLLKDSMLIDFDKDYSVSVEYNGKSITTTFKTTTNIPITINEVRIDSFVEQDPFGGELKTYYAYLKWQDPPSEKNYYCIELYGLVKDENGDTSRIALTNYYDNLYLSDEGKNGTEMNTTLEVYTSNFEFLGQNYIGFDAVITKTDEHYYRYFKSLQNFGGDDPFSEPTLIYTNVNNGLGLIGCYSPFFYRKLL